MADAEIQDEAPLPPPPEGAPGKGSTIDAGADLIETAVRYVRQEVGDLVHDRVVAPIQQAGAWAAIAVGAAIVIAVGVGFVATGLLIILANLITWPGALLLIGIVMIVGAGAVVAIKARSTQ